MNNRDGISCVIVSYNSIGVLKSCLDSLNKQVDVEKEVIIVDNNSSDGTVPFLENIDATTILSRKNNGFGAAANAGIKKAAFKYVCILNPDTILPPDSLRKLYSHAENIDNWGLLAPVLRYPDGRPQLSARTLPSRIDFFMGRGSPLFKLGFTGEKEAGYISPDITEPLVVPSVSATAVFMRADFFTEIGGFDERFFMYLEDIDLCRKIQERGRKIVLLPDVIINHSWRASSSGRPYFTAFHHHLSVLKYFGKYNKNQLMRNILLSIALFGGFLVASLMIFIKKSGAGSR